MNFVFSVIRRAVASVQSLHLKKLAIAFVVSALLITSTACSSTPTAAKNSGVTDVDRESAAATYQEDGRKGAGDRSYEEREGTRTNTYDDVDQRQDTTRTEIKTKELVDRAKANVQKDLGDGLREGPPALTNDVKGKVESAKQTVSEESQEGFRNLQKNLDKAGRETKATLNEAKDDVKQSVRNAGNTVDELTDTAKRPMRRATNDAANAVDDAGKSLKSGGRTLKEQAADTIERTSEGVKQTGKDAADAIRR